MSGRGSTASRFSRALIALAVAPAVAGCTYDFDEFEGLAPPLDGGAAIPDGAIDVPRPDGARDASAKDISADVSSDSRSGDANSGQGGTAGSAGSGGAGGAGTGGTGAAGGTGGNAGAGTTGGTGGAGAGGAGTGGTGTGGSETGGTAGAGAGGSAGTGSGGTATGGSAGSGTGTGGSGTGGASTGGTAGSGTGGAAGTGTGGTAGARPDAGITPDVRVDVAADTTPPFDCAAVGGRTNQNHCYYAMTTPVTWAVASKQTCVAPAHIVTINNANEQNFVTSFLPGDSRWIGLYRPSGSAKSPSSYVWVTGEATGYSHWYTSNGEPDYDGECVRLGPSDSWGDHPCTATFPVICERE
jgi:hypothetical protein